MTYVQLGTFRYFCI